MESPFLPENRNFSDFNKNSFTRVFINKTLTKVTYYAGIIKKTKKAFS